MYSVNGIPLVNSTLGWRLRAPSRPLSEIVKRTTALRVPNMHGIIPVPGTFDAPILPIVVRTPKASREALLALFTQSTLLFSETTVPGRNVEAEFIGAPYESSGPADMFLDIRFMLRLNGVFWRDTTESTTAPVSLSAASVSTSVFAGLSAPVSDAVVRVAGATTLLRVTDAGGSWVTYDPSIPSGSYLRFHSDSGEAFVTSSDVWTGGTDVSGAIDFGGPRGVFEITPAFTDPAVRSGQLTVTTATRSGAQIQVRGKGAYLV